ncbi:MAG: hypothetical protein ACP5O0_07105 [Acidimicrobiales bacterium]
MQHGKIRTAGIALALIGMGALFLPLIPLGTTHISLSEAHSLCSSSLAQLASLFSASLARDCSAIGRFFMLSWLCIVGGIGITLYSYRHPRPGREQGSISPHGPTGPP